MLFVAVASSASCVSVVCFGFGNRCPHDINEELVDGSAVMVSIVVTIFVYCDQLLFAYAHTTTHTPKHTHTPTHTYTPAGRVHFLRSRRKCAALQHWRGGYGGGEGVGVCRGEVYWGDHVYV